MKKLILFCLFACFTFTIPTIFAEDFDAAAKHALALDITSGKILYEKSATESVEIASLTKLLTAYLVYEAIDKGEITLDSTVDISDYPYYLTVHPETSNLPMEARKYTVEQLLEAMLIANTDSAAIALAEKVAGSEPAFVDRMRSKLKSWRVSDATILNATGLNNRILGEAIYPDSEPEAENKASAYSLAVIARHLVVDFPQVLKITEKPTSSFAGIPIYTTNSMLEGLPSFRSGVNGLKTATSEKSGASFIGTTQQNGMKILTIILNADNAEENPYARFIATSQLMTYVMEEFSSISLVEKGNPYEKSSVSIINGKKERIKAVASQDFRIIRKKSDLQKDIKVEFTTDQAGYAAPLKKGVVVGKLTYDDTDLIGQGYIGNPKQSITMVTEETVDRPFFLKAWWNDFVQFVNEKL